MGLMLHKGAKLVPYEDLDRTPLPERTRTHVPVRHSRLVDLVTQQLSERGRRIVKAEYALSHDDQRFFGLMEVGNGDDAKHGFNMEVGLRNSHDKIFPEELILGKHVFVCDNLAFAGEIRIARKHGSRIEEELPALVAKAMIQLIADEVRQKARAGWYKQAELSHERAGSLLFEMGRTFTIPRRDIWKAWDRWQGGQDLYGGCTFWRLENAITEAVKARPTTQVARWSVNATRFLDEESGFLALPDQRIVDLAEAN